MYTIKNNIVTNENEINWNFFSKNKLLSLTLTRVELKKSR